MALGDSANRIKIWKATKEGIAGFMVTERAAYMVGSETGFIVANQIGVGIAGKSISFMTTSENIRQGGIFIQMNDFIRMIPQTLMTPVPSQVPFPPLGMVTSVVKDLPFFLALLI
jgi:hypothetical protein